MVDHGVALGVAVGRVMRIGIDPRDASRDLLSIVHNHMTFFANETCGFCVPCRASKNMMNKWSNFKRHSSNRPTLSSIPPYWKNTFRNCKHLRLLIHRPEEADILEK